MAVPDRARDENEQVRAHVGLVKWYVARHPARHISSRDDRDDLIAAGMEGLLRAVRTFDPASDYSFGTYATRCIQNQIHKHLRSWNGDKDTRPGRDRLRASHVSWDTPIASGRITRAEIIASDQPTPEAVVLHDHDIDPALAVLAELTTDPRHFVAFRLLAAGAEHQEAAAAVGVAPNTIRNWLNSWSRSRRLHDALAYEAA